MYSKDQIPRGVSPTDPISIMAVTNDISSFGDHDYDIGNKRARDSLPPPPVFMSPSRGVTGSLKLLKPNPLRHQRLSLRYSPVTTASERKGNLNKRVSFNESVVVRRHYSALSLADNQSHLLWYSQEELMKIMEKNRALVQQVLSNNGDPTTRSGKALCCRGLEKFLNPCAHFVQRDLAKKVVMAEQCLQLSTNKKVDADHLAFLYQVTTRRSKMSAAEMAIQDTKAVIPYLRSLKRKTSLLPHRHSLEGLYQKNIVGSATA